MAGRSHQGGEPLAAGSAKGFEVGLTLFVIVVLVFLVVGIWIRLIF